MMRITRIEKKFFFKLIDFWPSGSYLGLVVFFILEFHGIDLLSEIKKDRAAEEGIFNISSLVLPQAKEYSYYQEKLEHIDFSLINNLGESIGKAFSQAY